MCIILHPKPEVAILHPPMLLLRILRLREAKCVIQGHTADEEMLGSPTLVFLAPGSVPSSWQMEERGREAKAGARDEPCGRLAVGTDGICFLFLLLQDPGCANQALISKKLNDYRKVR